MRRRQLTFKQTLQIVKHPSHLLLLQFMHTSVAGCGSFYSDDRKRQKRTKGKKINGLQNALEYFEGQIDLQVWCSFPPLRHITFDKKAARCKIRHIFSLNSSSCGAQEFRMEVMSAPTATADLGWTGSNLDERAALGSSWPPPR